MVFGGQDPRGRRESGSWGRFIVDRAAMADLPAVALHRGAPGPGRVAGAPIGHKTWFDTIDEMQTVLDVYFFGYTTKRLH